MMREYAEYTPFGFSIAASFLLFLHEPDLMTYEEFASISLVDDQHNSYERGGETINRELRGLVKEMYDFHKRFGINL